jgi:SpoIID/LytB domain protein
MRWERLPGDNLVRRGQPKLVRPQPPVRRGALGVSAFLSRASVPTLLGVMVAVGGLVPADELVMASPAQAETRAALASVAISGFGDGHGVGMGQWGAFGYASRYGWTYKRILAHYYGGTSLGRLPSPEPDVKVHLLELEGRSTVAQGIEGGQLVASWPGGAPVGAGAFQVARRGGSELLYASSGCAGPWREVASTAGPVTLASATARVTPATATPATNASPTTTSAIATTTSASATTTSASATTTQHVSATTPSRPVGTVPVPADIAGSLVQVCRPGGGTRTYSGHLVVYAGGDTDNLVSLEAYVEAVVPAESPPSWAYQGGEAALQAQAVAARSYAVAMMASSGQICDTIACQVYDGVASRDAVGVDGAVYGAVASTAGEVLYCDVGSKCGRAGTVALAEYSASTGGYSAGGLFPAVADLGDSVEANPVHSWSREVPLRQLARHFPSLGVVTSVTVDRRNGLGQLGGRVLEVTVTGADGSARLSGAQFAADLSLPSDWFRLEKASSPSPHPRAATTTTSGQPHAAATTTTTTSGQPHAAATTTAPAPATASGPSAPAPSGYWVATSSGVVHAFGAARFYGNALRTTITGHVSAMAAAPGGRGYWLIGANGTVLSFGSAGWYGSASNLHLAAPVVGIAPTPDGHGYWLAARDGGVFAYGDARYYGSGLHQLHGQRVVSIAATSDGRGYWLVAASGAVLAFGDAHDYGSAAVSGPVPPVVALAAAPDGHGYWLVSAAGGAHGFGAAAFAGSLPTRRIVARVVAAAAPSSGEGYYMLASSGEVYGFGVDGSPGGRDTVLIGSLGRLSRAGRPVAVAAYRSGN